MEKIKITQAQAEAVEKAWKMSGNKVFIIRMHDRDGSVLIDGREQLGDISTDTLIKALYIGYEVEPEFNKGDFIVWHGSVMNIKNPQTNDHKDDGSCYFTLERSDGSTYGNISRYEIRPATPSEIAEEKERRWWRKHGRDVWGIKKDDILVCPQEQAYTVDGVSGGVVVFKEGSDKQMWKIKSIYKVICFAEDRKDVKKNNN